MWRMRSDERLRLAHMNIDKLVNDLWNLGQHDEIVDNMAKMKALVIEAIKAEREACYQAARGSNEADAFTKYGNRQLYWKGRSDAATAIRARNQ